MRPNGCAHCQSPNIEAELDRFFCFDCGGHTDFNGNALPRDAAFQAPARDQFEVQHGA